MKKLFLGLVLVLASSVQAYDTLPSWTLAWTNAANSVGTLVTDAAHGGWTLNVRKNSDYGGYGLTLGIYSGKAFYGSAVASGGGETGELDMRGTITGPTLDGTGTSTAWKITNLPDSCFRTDDGNGNANPALAVKILRTPGTLTTFQCPYHNDGLPHPDVTEIYVDESEYTGSIPSWLASGCEKLNILVLKVPKATSLSTYIAHYRSPRDLTSFDDFDLTSIMTVNGSAGGGAMQGWQAKGTLDLPSLQNVTVSNAFKGASNLGAVLLGTKGNLKEIGEQSFQNCNSLSNIVIGASPSGVTLKLGPNVFAATGIKRVWFNGATPPELQQKAGAYTFGTSATPQGQITFYVPDTPGWQSVLAQRDASGLVPASVFNTANPQYVKVWDGCVNCDLSKSHLMDDILGAKYGDTVEVTTPAMDEGGFPYATEKYSLSIFPITFSASTPGTPDEAGRSSVFYRWNGVSKARETENPLVVTVEDSIDDIKAFFSHDWTYDAAAQVISNGNWVINVSVVDSNKRTLRIGKSTNNPVDSTFSTAITGIGTGTLDFNGHVRDADGNEWSLTHMKSYSLCRARKWTSSDTTETFSDHPAVVVFPETLVSMDGNIFNFNQSQDFPLGEVVLIAPNLTGGLGWVINGPKLLNRMTLRIPKVTSLGANCIWQNAAFSQTDVTEWDLSSVTSVGDFAFACCTGMRGTLHLPSLVSLGHRNFQEHKYLSGVVLATNLTLTTVGSNAFLNATSLRNVTIGNAKDGVTVGQNAFKGTSGVKSVTFLGPRDEAIADAVLNGVSATTGAKTATVNAPLAQEWGDSVSAATGDEIAAKPAGVAGVYREGSRKAWLVYTPSPFDPRGTLIIVK